MCGICGKIDLLGREIPESLLKNMCDVLAHRGPDASGTYFQSSNDSKSGISVGLGHRRLKVIDLSDAANQPASNEDGSVQVIYNGEIYNFLQIREELIAKGHRFKTVSDTEVIVHLYEEEGIECLKKLRGQFAFAVWDSISGRLFLARDRMGQKPLYYSKCGDTLVFASELKSILQDASVPREVDKNAVDMFLSYMCVPSPHTILKGVKKLPPAHYVLFDKDTFTVERYWKLDHTEKMILSEDEWIEKVISMLDETTRMRMISDVSLGAFLSGGIDSSAVVAAMSLSSSKRVKTFSIGFKESCYDETQFAKIVADKYNTEHRAFIIEPDVMECLADLIWYYGEPYSDSSAIACYYLSKMTRKEVTVALNGDGGDEAFGGYERYLAGRMAGQYQRLPYFLRKGVIAPLVDLLPNKVSRKNKLARLKRFFSVINENAVDRHYSWSSVFFDSHKDMMYTDSMKNGLNGMGAYDYIKDVYDFVKTDDVVDSLMALDIHTNLPEDLCVKMDIASMSNSLETRSPFLDHKFMELTASMPSFLKIKQGKLKYILKAALKKKGLLPDSILNRPKMGFAVPLDFWFRGKLKNLAISVLTDKKTINRGYFRKEFIEKILGEHFQGKCDHSFRIWSLINLELWQRMFLESDVIRKEDAFCELTGQIGR